MFMFNLNKNNFLYYIPISGVVVRGQYKNKNGIAFMFMVSLWTSK